MTPDINMRDFTKQLNDFMQKIRDDNPNQEVQVKTVKFTDYDPFEHTVVITLNYQVTPLP